MLRAEAGAVQCLGGGGSAPEGLASQQSAFLGGGLRLDDSEADVALPQACTALVFNDFQWLSPRNGFCFDAWWAGPRLLEVLEYRS